MFDKLIKLILVFYTGFLFLLAIYSIQWRMVHDSPIQLYIAFLIDRFHYVIYRDIFEINMLGTFLFNVMVGIIFGYNDLAFRTADLSYLGLILVVTWFWMKKLGDRIAWGGVVMFGLYYLICGPMMSMQRDYYIVLPLALAILTASSRPWGNDFLRFFVVGILFGLVAMIKPHGAIGYPLVLAFQIRESATSCRPRRIILNITFSFLGILIPFGVGMAYLYRQGALQQFLETAINAWPMYGKVTNQWTLLYGFPRIVYLYQNYLNFDGRIIWIPAAIIGLHSFLFITPLRDAATKRLALLIAGLALMYSIMTLFAGQFWNYHWLLFNYFILMLGALCLAKPQQVPNKLASYFSSMLLLTFFTLSILAPLKDLFIHSLDPPKNGRVDEIALFLKSRLRPGDKVQPLDWTGGSIQAMLMSGAQLATPFTADFYFYMNMDKPYTQVLRRRFIQNLSAVQPRYIIQVETNRPWPSGINTTREFPELKILLNRDYQNIKRGEGYLIYERLNQASRRTSCTNNGSNPIAPPEPPRVLRRLGYVSPATMAGLL